MSDLISRQDAIDAIEGETTEVWTESDADFNRGMEMAKSIVESFQSADRPTGEVNAVEIYEQSVSELVNNKITLGEYEKRIEPLMHLYYDRPTGWIPVSERLPEGDELVLVTVLGHVRIWRMGISKVDVTAWMPLPEPYREDREA